MFDFADPSFINSIKPKAREIIEQAKNSVLNHRNYPILINHYLNNFWLNRADRKEMFILSISEDDIFNLQLDKVQDSLDNGITNILKSHSFINLNYKFDIIDSSTFPYQETQEGRIFLTNLSKENKCIFFFGENGISSFIQGDERGKNIFLTVQDRVNYHKKFTLEDIKQAFDRYKNLHLTRQHIYKEFFETKKMLSKVYGNYDKKKNLLKNSPERYFRDDLIDFLNQNVQGTFNREMELLSSKRPIDIHVESKKDGTLVFFEVKWLGVSKHKDKDEEGKSYINKAASDRANEGVQQTLEYIEELIERMDVDLKCGYLVVFDARNERAALTYIDPKLLPENLQKFYKDKFDKIDNLIVNNINPTD